MPFVSSFFPGRISVSEKDFYIFFSPFSSCDRLENSLPLSVVKGLKYSCSSLRIIFFTDFTIEAASHFQVFWVRSFHVFRSTRVIIHGSSFLSRDQAPNDPILLWKEWLGIVDQHFFRITFYPFLVVHLIAFLGKSVFS